MGKKEYQGPRYTKVDAWLARRTDITWPEKMILAMCIHFKDRGLFMSNGQLAHNLGINISTIKRSIVRLWQVRWIYPLYQNKRSRILYIDFEIIDGEEPLLPPYEEALGRLKMSQSKSATRGKMSQSKAQNEPPTRGIMSQSKAQNEPPPYKEDIRSYIIGDKRNDIKEQILFAASMISETDSRPSNTEDNRRRNHLKDQLDQMGGK